MCIYIYSCIYIIGVEKQSSQNLEMCRLNVSADLCKRICSVFIIFAISPAEWRPYPHLAPSTFVKRINIIST